MENPKLTRVLIASAIAMCIMAFLLIFKPQNALKPYNDYGSLLLPLFSEVPYSHNSEALQESRLKWEFSRLENPLTGEIPAGIRNREIAYWRNLQDKLKTKAAKEYDWVAMGPYNVGGRTRALAFDVTNENVLFAGGVSGGLWRSVDGGYSWNKVTAPYQHHSITTIAQDLRPGKTNTWYYGTGEAYGNSASKSFSANYLGTGMYKSTDGGLTWDTISSTVSGTPQKNDLWDLIWRVAVDPSVDSVDIVYAAAQKKIYRSDNGGTAWTEVLNAAGAGTVFTDISVTSTGIVYATLSSNASNKGIWRSGDHGLTWTNISNGSGWPGTYNRIVIGISPSDENTLYFLSNTPGSGQQSNVFFGEVEWNSLWKYTYLTDSGADSNGVWTNLSSNIPNNGTAMDNFNAQGSYNLVVAVKPDDLNTVFIGGTNLFRSTDGFTTSNNITHIGGYKPGSTIPFYEVYPNHHPDNHGLQFLPSNPNVLISSTDGGVFKTMDCSAPTVSWTSLDNGYRTSQFYTIAIDHGPANNDVIFGGLQDNGSWWTNTSNPTMPWTMPSAGDGSYCAVSDGGQYYYFSRQEGKIVKTTLDANGIPTAFRRIDPITTDTNGGTYLFINPFILDPTDNNIMYLAEFFNLWRNDDLASIPLTNEYDTISIGWTQLTNIVPLINSYITTLACSKSNPGHRLYYGANNKRIYRVDSANTGNPSSVDITNNINNGGYTSCIAIDPRDADKVMVVYSNYDVYSLYYTIDGGNYWMQVSGNLETGPPIGAPSWMVHLGDGPSCRWAGIIPLGDSTLYLLGTSVGLFTTYKLIDDSTANDSTVWIPQAANTIGNVVADMIDFRESDGFVVIGTHGSGVYATRLFSDTTGLDEQGFRLQFTDISAFPNPAKDHITFSFELLQSSSVKLIIYDLSGNTTGAVVNETLQKGAHKFGYDTHKLAAGVYFYNFTAGGIKKSGKFIVINF